MFEELEITLTERNTLQDALPVNLLADHIPANIKEINFVLSPREGSDRKTTIL